MTDSHESIYNFPSMTAEFITQQTGFRLGITFTEFPGPDHFVSPGYHDEFDRLRREFGEDNTISSLYIDEVGVIQLGIFVRDKAIEAFEEATGVVEPTDDQQTEGIEDVKELVIPKAGSPEFLEAQRLMGLEEGDRLLVTSEVARLFQVTPRAITDAATKNRIPHIRTQGGQYRFRASVIRQLLEARARVEELETTDPESET